MQIEDFKKIIQKNFEQMTEDGAPLFEVAVDKDELWNLYLDSFPAGTNMLYRERREFDCSCCRHFIKSIGNAVVIKDNKIVTIWDVHTGDTKFQPVADALAAYIRDHAVTDIYVTGEKRIGTDKNHAQLESGEVVTYEHFCLDLPSHLVNLKKRGFEGEIQGRYRDTKNVFKRSLEEIEEESILTVLELIAQNSLYKGEEWKEVLTRFLEYKNGYDSLTDENEKENYAWEKSVKAGTAIGKIRNHSIGTLLVNLSEGMELDTAVKKYEQIVAPANYKRPKAIYTKKMLEEARQKMEEMGYLPSLERRFATLDDITVNNILFCNRDAGRRISGTDVFADMEKDIPVNLKKFSKVEEVTADDFVKNILPMAREVEVLLENRHAANMVSLIAPKNADSPTMFKWNNGFSWAYSGNITDSDIRENVKSAGGRVDGDLRFSIQWNECGTDNCDMDAHCKEANGDHIDYSTFKKPAFSRTKGQLDVDIISPDGRVAVENITWASRETMKAGKYLFFVHMYNGSSKNGFRAEIEFDGTIYSFDYAKPTRKGEEINVAEVTLDGNGRFSIKELMPSNVSSKEIWGLKSNQFIPVSVVMYSPNYWDMQEGVGHRHYFFMLKDCVNPEMPNGFYNEFLKNSLTEHKRVFEALGSKMHVENVDDQLSGLGFSATKRNDVLVKVKGTSERVVKVKF